MLLEEFGIWFVVWVFFSLLMLSRRRLGWFFSFFSGLWSIFLGIYVNISGIQYCSGKAVVYSDEFNYTVTKVFSNFVMPYSSYSFLWGIIFILVGVFLIYYSVSRMR